MLQRSLPTLSWARTGAHITVGDSGWWSFWCSCAALSAREKVRENMFELEGVQDVMVNPATQRVTVTGFVDPMRTLKKARKVKWNSQLLSGDHLIPASSKRHHRSEYRRRASAYQAPPVSASGFVHQPASPYQSSYNLRAPASYGHAVRLSYDEMVITNPCYVKHIEHDGHWY